MGLPDRQNVTRLVEEHYASLYRYAYRLTGSQAEAEDLTQEAFCSAQAKTEQLRDWSRARSWLFSILRNAYLHKVRSESVRPLILVDDLSDAVEPVPVEPFDVEPHKLQEALEEMPEEFRTPVILFYFEEFSYRDIAEQMEVPLGTVMSRLARAKAHLRARLVPAEVEGPSR